MRLLRFSLLPTGEGQLVTFDVLKDIGGGGHSREVEGV